MKFHKKSTKPSFYRIPLSLLPAQGAYCVTLTVGEPAQSLQFIVDTGSSALALRASRYRQTQDPHLAITPWVQWVRYGAGGWWGSVVQTQLGLAQTPWQSQANIAIVEDEADLAWHAADGIWGLASKSLDVAHDVSEWLQSQNLQATWPSPSGLHHESLAAIRQQFQHFPEVTLTPWLQPFAHQQWPSFALMLQSSLVEDVVQPEQARDNHGALIVGDNPRCETLYHAPLRLLRQVSSRYYSVRIGGFRVATQPRRDWSQFVSEQQTEAMVDSGCSAWLLPSPCYQQLLEDIAATSPLGSQWLEQMTRQQPVPIAELALEQWPDIEGYFQADGELASGGTAEDMISLRLTPAHYWQLHYPQYGVATCLLAKAPSSWQGPTVLGLPWMHQRFWWFGHNDQGQSVLGVAEAR